MPAHEATAVERIYKRISELPPDIEIARQAYLQPIIDIGLRAGFRREELEPYGEYKAKINHRAFDRLGGRSDGKLILITAMTPTTAGEGKTLTSVGLAQAMGKLGLSHMLCIREPSLGPTFGLKGGAAGGGYAQVLPMEEINMHFTGDMHAVTTAHNLLAATVDNHVFHGNELDIDPRRIVWRRVIDLCDRQLRQCEIGLGTRFDGFPHVTGFDITAASEIMAILALATDLEDLHHRLARVIVAFRRNNEPVMAGQLEVVGAMMVLLRDAINPNIVQTIENTPALIHCGPFGNIAHGCNSVRSTCLALKVADYVVTEAGFGADLGAEKFINIKCRAAGLRPHAVVFVISCRALKRHGGTAPDRLTEGDRVAVEKGLDNVRVHLENLSKFGVPIVAAVNRFSFDQPDELNRVFEFCREFGVPAALSEVAALGGEGGIELAQKVVRAVGDADASRFRFLYDEKDPIKAKIETIAREMYRADGVDYEEEAEAGIRLLEKLQLDRNPLCIAKTQSSVSDDPKKLGAPSRWRLTVNDVRISNGAGFIVVLTGKMLLMPGMPKHLNMAQIGVDHEGKVFGLS